MAAGPERITIIMIIYKNKLYIAKMKLEKNAECACGIGWLYKDIC